MAVPKWNDGSKWNQVGSVWGPLFEDVGRWVRVIWAPIGRRTTWMSIGKRVKWK